MDTALAHANIENLTGLWRLMGCVEQEEGLTQSTRWPYRCWQGIDRQTEDGPGVTGQIPAGYLYPVWQAGDTTTRLEQQLQQKGLQVGLEQLAMILPLAHDYPATASPRLEVSRVQNHREAEAWTELCGRAFGYQLDTDVIDHLRQEAGVEVLWAFRKEEPVATAILNRTGPVMGLHQVGVPPELQGQGIARELMQVLLAHAQAAGAEYVCLQASAAGEPLYRRLGFQPQFRIRSYRRT